MPEDSTAEPSAKKSSAAEVLSALRDEVGLMASRLDEIADFTLLAKDALVKQADRQRLDTFGVLVGSIFQIHDVVHRQLLAAGDDAFLAALLQAIEGELHRSGIEVVAPAIGDAHDSACMKILAQQPVGDNVSGSIARIHRCGFEADLGGQKQLLRKVEVDIFRD